MLWAQLASQSSCIIKGDPVLDGSFVIVGDIYNGVLSLHHTAMLALGTAGHSRFAPETSSSKTIIKE